MTSPSLSLKAKFAAIFTLLTFYLLLASNAFAAGGGAERAGKNIGHMLSTLGGYLLVSIAGMIAIGILAARKFPLIGTLFVMVFLVGGFVYAPERIADIIKSTWDAIARGT